MSLLDQRLRDVLQTRILPEFDGETLHTLSRTCKQLHTFIIEDNEDLWEELCLKNTAFVSAKKVRNESWLETWRGLKIATGSTIHFSKVWDRLTYVKEELRKGISQIQKLTHFS
jgi:hypothetical protein